MKFRIQQTFAGSGSATLVQTHRHSRILPAPQVGNDGSERGKSPQKTNNEQTLPGIMSWIPPGDWMSPREHPWEHGGGLLKIRRSEMERFPQRGSCWAHSVDARKTLVSWPWSVPSKPLMAVNARHRRPRCSQQAQRYHGVCQECRFAKTLGCGGIHPPPLGSGRHLVLLPPRKESQ